MWVYVTVHVKCTCHVQNKQFLESEFDVISFRVIVMARRWNTRRRRDSNYDLVLPPAAEDEKSDVAAKESISVKRKPVHPE